MHKRFPRFVTLLIVSFCLLFSSVTTKAQDTTYPLDIQSIKMQAMPGNAQVYELLINDKVVLRYRSMAQGLSASQRTNIILNRIKAMQSDIVKGPLTTGRLNGCPVILIKNKLLITVTREDWEANRSTGDGLATIWLQNFLNTLSSRGTQNQQVTQEQPIPNEVQDVPVVIEPPSPVINPSGQQTDNSGYASLEELKMLELINRERQLAGVPPLTMDNELVRVARIKSQDMIEKNYFAHTSPTYGDPFAMMKSFGISYGYAGENLAGNQTVERAHEALMNSSGHRKNILNANYRHVGIGIIEGGPYGKMFTQLFTD